MHSELTISREYQCSISNAFLRRLMFAYNNIYLHLTLQIVNFENENIYIQLQSSSSNAAKYMFKFKLIQFDL